MKATLYSSPLSEQLGGTAPQINYNEAKIISHPKQFMDDGRAKGTHI